MIQHVAREVSPEALEPCVGFYRQLGFAEVPVPGGLTGRARWLQLGPTQLHLLPRPGARAETGHIAIACADFDELIERLAAAGTPAEPRTAHWGARRAGVRDPAGHLVELMEHPPA